MNYHEACKHCVLSGMCLFQRNDDVESCEDVINYKSEDKDTKNKEDKQEMKFSSDVLILMCAFRYALGRRTYIVDVIANEIKSNWDEIPEYIRVLIHKEINEAMSGGYIGDDCDKETWETILKLPKDKEDNNA